MEHRKTIHLRIFDESGYRMLEEALKDVDQYMGKKYLAQVLYTALSELISNAAKANMKRAYFQEHGYRLDDPLSYRRGLADFKASYPILNTDKKYLQALKDLDLEVQVDFDLNSDRLLIHVENNSLLIQEEEKRVRENLAAAMKAADVWQYSLNYGDETEGAGLGLAMVIQILKKLGFNPDHFRVFKRRDRTVARIELPLSENYRPIRERRDSPRD